jgi:hypothetical protein
VERHLVLSEFCNDNRIRDGAESIESGELLVVKSREEDGWAGGKIGVVELDIEL